MDKSRSSVTGYVHTSREYGEDHAKAFGPGDRVADIATVAITGRFPEASNV